jgi:hypothetical protein
MRKKKNHPLLEQAIERGLRGEVPDAQVYRPKKINGRPVREVAIVRRQQLPDVRGEMLRILTEADPIGFLIAVTQGMAFETHFITKTGDVVTEYEYADLKERIKVARYLTDKVIPKLAVVRHIVPEDLGGNPAEPSSGMSWAQIVEKAGQPRNDE